GPEVGLDPLPRHLVVVHVDDGHVVPRDAASGRCNAEEGPHVCRLDSATDRERGAAFDHIIVFEFHAAECGHDVPLPIPECDVEACCPTSEAEAVFRVAWKIDDLTKMLVILSLETLLKGGVHQEWAAHDCPLSMNMLNDK